MADDDDDDLYGDDEQASAKGGGDGDDLSGLPGAEGGADGGNSLGISKQAIMAWLTRRRGWVLIAGLAIAQGLFAIIMIYLRSEARPVVRTDTRSVRDLALDMLGHEVKFNQIYQLIPLRGGKRMTVGLDISLMLGQLPEERIEGSPRPTPEEMAVFVQTIQGMDERVRSRVNSLLQQMAREDYGTADAHKFITEDMKKYINDALEGFNYGESVRKEIGKRRVTDVLLPMFIRQMM